MSRDYRKESAEVLYSDAAITDVTRAEIEELKALATRNPRARVRLCAHHHRGDRLHEMLIVHERSAYVRPHTHLGKTESTHIIEGQADVVVFADNGAVERVIELGDYASGRTFYYRMTKPAFHTLIIRSDVLVFHETTDGPFDRKDTLFASWAPEAGDTDAVNRYLADLNKRIGTQLATT